MTWFEYLSWRLHGWRVRRRCARRGHDDIGPEQMTAGGHYVYVCRRCGGRFYARTVVPGSL